MQEKMERIKLSEEILHRLKEMIKSDQYGYGDKLPVEKRLAEIFGVSRTTVREAMAVLEAEGWVTTRRGGGSYVKRVRGQDPIEPLNVMMGSNNKALLELMAKENQTVSQLRHAIPRYAMVKEKTRVRPEQIPEALRQLRRTYAKIGRAHV